MDRRRERDVDVDERASSETARRRGDSFHFAVASLGGIFNVIGGECNVISRVTRRRASSSRVNERNTRDMTSVNDARGTSTSSVAVGANAKANVECSEIDASGKLATALRRYLVANHVKTRRTVARRVAKDGLTPLHVAALNGSVDVVRMLVTERGVDANETDRSQWTALHLAAQQNESDVVRVLTNEGRADVERGEEEGWTALHVAAQYDATDAARALLKECDADAEAATSGGAAPLHIAAHNNMIAVIRVLLNEGLADVNAYDKDGCTPLHIAASQRVPRRAMV